MTIKKIYLPRIINNDELNTIKGQYLDDEFILHTIQRDTDVYEEDTNILVRDIKLVI